MEPNFRFIVAIVFIFTSALGAPTLDRRGDACISVKSSSSRLNKIARTLSVETNFGIANVTHLTIDIPWMNAQDKCDPGSLRNDVKPCIMKMATVLRRYNSIMEIEQIGKLPVCSKFTRQIKQAMDQFYTDMMHCVTATSEHLPEFSDTTAPLREERPRWDAKHVCRFIMERLFSFSILSARVFAVGDPAQHGHAPAVECM